MKNTGAGADGQHSAIDSWFWCVRENCSFGKLHSPAAVAPYVLALTRESFMLLSPRRRWAWPTNSGDTKGIVDSNWVDILWQKVCASPPRSSCLFCMPAILPRRTILRVNAVCSHFYASTYV